MTTRHAPEGAPLSQGKYLSSPEYAELRGLSGVAVAAKAALFDHPAKRSLLWFLQALSFEKGGLKKVAAELVAMFPERIGSPTMHRLGIKLGSAYSVGDARSIAWELQTPSGQRRFSAAELILLGLEKPPGGQRPRDWSPRAPMRPGEESQLLRPAKRPPPRPEDILLAAMPAGPYPAEDFFEQCRREAQSHLPRFLIDLCINPRISLPAPGETKVDPLEASRVCEEFPSLGSGDIESACVSYFRDIIGALYEYQRRHQIKERAEFVLTEIGRKVWDTLDFALKARRMVLIDGLEGRGKSEAAKAWCRLHLGETRFISLKGITGKTNLFRTISQALGVGCGRGYSALEMQNRIEDVLHRSGLALIFDEAHFLFDPKPRMYARPELVDWVDTALCNHGIPVGLVSTPQLLKSVQQAGAQTGWNHRQFRRRVKRYVQLPEWNTDADLASVARKLLPGIAREGIKLAVGYTKLSKRDVSGLGDVAEESRFLAAEDGRQAITFEDVERAINEHLLPSDTAFAKALSSPAKNTRRQSRSAASEPLQPPCSATAAPLSSETDGDEVAPEAEEFPERATHPADFDRRSAGGRAVVDSHRQTRPVLVPV